MAEIKDITYVLQGSMPITPGHFPQEVVRWLADGRRVRVTFEVVEPQVTTTVMREDGSGVGTLVSSEVTDERSAEVIAELIAELESQLSSMVSARDLTIRDLKTEQLFLAEVATAAHELLQVVDKDKNWRSTPVIDAITKLRGADNRLRERPGHG